MIDLADQHLMARRSQHRCRRTRSATRSHPARLPINSQIARSDAPTFAPKREFPLWSGEYSCLSENCSRSTFVENQPEWRWPKRQRERLSISSLFNALDARELPATLMTELGLLA